MIETERLRLRNWRPEDVVAFDTYTNTENVMRWLGGVRSREALELVVRDRFIAWQEDLGHTFWVVERKSDGAFLGFCGLKVADDGGSPVEGNMEVGWRFREDVWGQGYAKEAAIASIDYAFDEIGVPQVIALTVEGNKASWGLMERLGMKRRPDLDYEGPEWAEGIVIAYVLRREEWRI
ncbi:MAG TPA: GNAT family N-acetyltransferase [Allosphingosinicella sp.]|jgi:RimJ/RimL family protein N-acetyltransferase